LSPISINKYHLNEKTGAAVAAIAGAERRASTTEATVREASRAGPAEAGALVRGLCDG